MSAKKSRLEASRRFATPSAQTANANLWEKLPEDTWHSIEPFLTPFETLKLSRTKREAQGRFQDTRHICRDLEQCRGWRQRENRKDWERCGNICDLTCTQLLAPIVLSGETFQICIPLPNTWSIEFAVTIARQYRRVTISLADHLQRLLLKQEQEYGLDDPEMFAPEAVPQLPESMQVVWNRAHGLARSHVRGEWEEDEAQWMLSADVKNADLLDAVMLLCELLFVFVSPVRGVILEHSVDATGAQEQTAPTIIALRRILGEDIPMEVAPAREPREKMSPAALAFLRAQFPTVRIPTLSVRGILRRRRRQQDIEAHQADVDVEAQPVAEESLPE